MSITLKSQNVITQEEKQYGFWGKTCISVTINNSVPFLKKKKVYFPLAEFSQVWQHICMEFVAMKIIELLSKAMVIFILGFHSLLLILASQYLLCDKFLTHPSVADTCFHNSQAAILKVQSDSRDAWVPQDQWAWSPGSF